MQIQLLNCNWINTYYLNTLRPRWNVRHFADSIFKCIFIYEKVSMLIQISLNFIPKSPIYIKAALVQIMVWHRTVANKWRPSLLTHICVTRPWWVKAIWNSTRGWYSIFTKYAHGLAVFCFDVAMILSGFVWFVYSYPSGLLYLHWGNSLRNPEGYDYNWAVSNPTRTQESPNRMHNSWDVLIYMPYHIYI